MNARITVFRNGQSENTSTQITAGAMSRYGVYHRCCFTSTPRFASYLDTFSLQYLTAASSACFAEIWPWIARAICCVE